MSNTKRARKIRQANEIKRVTTALTTPKWDTGVFSWSLADIRAARDAQMRGEFRLAAALADSFKTDDAMFVALKNRLDALDAIGFELTIGEGPKAECILRDAMGLYGPDGCAVTADTMRDIRADRINHGVGIGHIVQVARENGSRIDFYLEHWPIKHVRFDKTKRKLVTRVDGHTGEAEINHGDGEWVVFATSETEPWKKDAAVLPGALVWAAHAFAANDWAKGSRSHGNAKVVGEMPEGYAIEDDGGITREAQQFLALLNAVANDDGPSGLKPFGSKLEYLTNNSSAWQVWESLMVNREKAAARIYLGTDGILGAQGGAPGVDITALFGVSAIIVQGDLKKDRASLGSGFYAPWAATNYGCSEGVFSITYLMPDQDEETVRSNYAERDSKFHATIKVAKENGFLFNQKFVDKVALKYGIEAPLLAVSAPSGADFFAYELDAGVWTLDEVRAQKGKGPLPNGSGAMTVPQSKALATGTTPIVSPPVAVATEGAEIDAGPGYSQRLADKMTAGKIERCVHGGVNVCKICGIRKEVDYDLNDDGVPDLDAEGKPVSSFAWTPI